MDLQELKNTIESGESEKVEFKTSFTDAVIETLVAFSNCKGGSVLIGIDDHATIKGIQTGKETIAKWINEIKIKTSPSIVADITLQALEEKLVAVISVSEYPVKPVSFKGKYYRRISKSNHLMGTDEIAIQHLKTLNSSWDYFPDPYHSTDDISIEKVNLFLNKSGFQVKLGLTPLESLVKLEMIRNGSLTLGAYLLFVKDFCLITDVQVGRFKSPTTIIDSVSLNTDLFAEVDEIMAFIKKHLMVEYIITGNPERTERFDYPIEAIREIVINMVVHRDYRDSSASIVKIFDDRIEFYNPGKLYGGITINDLLSGNYSSKTRNKLIARAFKEVGLIERYGSGIMRTRKICDEYGVKMPLFEEWSQGFRVILFKEKVSEIKNDLENDLKENLSEREKSILKEIKQKPKITQNELSQIIGISPKNIRINIKSLKDKGFLERIGADKGGYWSVNERKNYE
ncbi:MAG: winged helix-turn-helix transcriptional regulator [Bacteroidetes bacterium]|nr:MAG: winged helix-turn-helix transcriptional regulator [Bacteroidota bacterium]